MSNFRKFFIVSIIAFIVFTAWALVGKFEPPVAIFPAIMGYGFLSLYAAYLIGKRLPFLTEEERSHSLLKDFRSIFLVLGAFLLLDAIPHSILPIWFPDETTITVTHWIAHIFYTIAAVLIGRIAVSLYNPALKNSATIVFALLALAALCGSMIWRDATIIPPFASMPLIATHQIFTYISTALIVATYGFAAVYVLAKSMRQGVTHEVRIRSSFIFVAALAKVLLLNTVNYAPLVFPIPWLAMIPLIIVVLQYFWIAFLGYAALYTQKA